MKRFLRAASAGLVLAILFAGAQAHAAVAVDVVRVDLKPLIRGAMLSPSQFAVPLVHPASLTGSGTWAVTDGRAQWHYSAQVPGAVSLSFLATQAMLPADATLSVRAGTTLVRYRARDVHRGQLWSRISPGDLIELTLEVAASERAHTVLNIAMLQAGYRSLGAGIPDHPYYRKLALRQAATPAENSACAQNFACSVNAANTAAGLATVGLVVGNLYQCTGTLLNDVPGDNTPYVLTARHCQTGKLGGGNPGAAATVTVYWNAVTACGLALGSLYDPNVPVQTGAVSVVEQQDAWLIRLDSSPVVEGAQFAGFDASGTAVQGGYTIHHALGFDKQLASWQGAALALRRSGVLGAGYVSDFWEVVNARGNSGPGASGSGLFDANAHLVGSLTLGRNTADASGYESCPASVPPAPDGTNGTNDFTSLAAVWNSSADPTGSTATLASVLDPEGTGTLQTASAPAASVAFTSSLTTAEIGAVAQLTWSATGATACAAGGGAPGDGWSGSIAASATQSVSEPAAGTVTYLLNCVLPAGRSVSAAVTITWSPPTPVVSFTSSGTLWAGRPASLVWSSNEAPCSITGGALAATGLGSSGTITTTQGTAGYMQYQVSCGSGAGQSVSATTQVQFVAPDVLLQANGTERRTGEEFFLTWQSYADSCTPSGGAPGDGWTGTAFPDPSVTSRFDPAVSTTGTYTYTLTCFSGTASVTKSLTVTFEDAAPFATLAIDRTSEVFTGSAADLISLNWNSNLSSCALQSSPPITEVVLGAGPQDGARLSPTPGTYTLEVVCAGNGNGLSAASAAVSLAVLAPPPPTASIAVSPGSLTAGGHFTVSWTSSYASDCEGSGAPPDVGWGGTQTASGTRDFTSSMVGSYAITISCHAVWGSLPATSAQAPVTLTAPAVLAVSLATSAASVTVGQSFTLSWSSQNVSSCNAGGGGAGAGWSGSLAPTGSAAQAATVAGTFTYLISCGAGTQSVEAQSTVTVAAAPAAAHTGGGGTLDLAVLCVLGLCLARRIALRG